MTTDPTRSGDSPKPRKALVTGSAAPFAERLVGQLEALGWEVSTIVHDDPNLLPATHALHLDAPAPSALAMAVPDVDAVILLSGIDSLTSMVDDSRDLDAILGGLTPGSALVEVTTISMYGDVTGDRPVDEHDTPVVPAELDPVAACEIRVMASHDWLRGVVVRPGLVYGDGGGLALAPAVEVARTHGASRYFGDGSESLPTVHEDELLDLLTRVVTDPSARGIYHATSGSVTTRELAKVVAAAADVDTVERWTPDAWQAAFGTRDQPPRVDVRTDGSRGRAGKELGWSPTAPPLERAMAVAATPAPPSTG